MRKETIFLESIVSVSVFSPACSREAGKVEDKEAEKVEELEELRQGFRCCN